MSNHKNDPDPICSRYRYGQRHTECLCTETTTAEAIGRDDDEFFIEVSHGRLTRPLFSALALQCQCMLLMPETRLGLFVSIPILIARHPLPAITIPELLPFCIVGIKLLSLFSALLKPL